LRCRPDGEWAASCGNQKYVLQMNLEGVGWGWRDEQWSARAHLQRRCRPGGEWAAPRSTLYLPVPASSLQMRACTGEVAAYKLRPTVPCGTCPLLHPYTLAVMSPVHAHVCRLDAEAFGVSAPAAAPAAPAPQAARAAAGPAAAAAAAPASDGELPGAQGGISSSPAAGPGPSDAGSAGGGAGAPVGEGARLFTSTPAWLGSGGKLHTHQVRGCACAACVRCVCECARTACVRACVFACVPVQPSPAHHLTDHLPLCHCCVACVPSVCPLMPRDLAETAWDRCTLFTADPINPMCFTHSLPMALAATHFSP